MQTRKVGKLGVVLVNSKGRTLYMFVPDHQKRVTCKGSCAVSWPPLKVKKGQKPTAGGAAKQKLLGTDGRVVTYNRWPLYTYILDQKPGQANRAGHQAQRRPLVRPLALGQDHQEEVGASS